MQVIYLDVIQVLYVRFSAAKHAEGCHRALIIQYLFLCLYRLNHQVYHVSIWCSVAIPLFSVNFFGQGMNMLDTAD